MDFAHQMRWLVDEAYPDAEVVTCPAAGSSALEVIELPVVPAQVTEHVYIARTCPAADGAAHLRRNWAAWSWVSSASASPAQPDRPLREEGRLPIRSVQWYLDTVHQLRLRVGAIVSAIHRTAQRAQQWPRSWTASAAARWSTPTKPAGARTAPMATCGLSAPPPNATSCGGVGARRWWTKRWASRSREYWSAISTPPTTIMTPQTAGPTPVQARGQALLRDIHDQRTLYPDAAPLARWADAVHGIYDRAKAFTHPQAKRRRTAQLALERTAGPRPALPARPVQPRPSCADASSATSKTLRLRGRTRSAFSNAAERSLRHLVISRKISGGISDEAELRREVAALESERNAARSVINWRFTPKMLAVSSNISIRQNQIETDSDRRRADRRL